LYAHVHAQVIKLISQVIADFANGEISQAASLFDTETVGTSTAFLLNLSRAVLAVLEFSTGHRRCKLLYLIIIFCLV